MRKRLKEDVNSSPVVWRVDFYNYEDEELTEKSEPIASFEFTLDDFLSTHPHLEKYFSTKENAEEFTYDNRSEIHYSLRNFALNKFGRLIDKKNIGEFGLGYDLVLVKNDLESGVKRLGRFLGKKLLPLYPQFEESLNESIPAKAKKEIAGWWKEVEAWNKKKKEFNISNDYNDVEGMHTAMFDMLDELKSRNKDLYEKGRKIYNKYSDVPIKKSKVREAYGDELEDEDGAPMVTGMDGHRYGRSSSKSVRDSDGFWTDYTAWIDLDDVGRVIFIFGDNELYDPSNESPDWECDTGENAQEWFDNYEGFDDEDDEDYYGESLNKSLTEADTLARNFKKDIKSRYKSWDSRNDYKNSKRKELKKMLDSSNFPKDKANSIVDIMEPEEKPFEYELPKHLETKDFPFYVTYYEEHPYYHPEEGGYYVAGRYADYSEGFDSKEEANQFARELANKEGLSRVNDTYYNKPSKYFGEEEHIWVETARDYLSHEKGDTPYE